MCVPRVFVIKKQSSETCNALIVMDDMSDRAIIGELTDGIRIEVRTNYYNSGCTSHVCMSLQGVRDLLRVIAQVP